jgi:hypothetical protein
MTTAAKIVRCQRCRKRCRNMAGWNTDHIAGLLVGYLCPGCQTPEENAEAAINEVLDPPSKPITGSSPEDFMRQLIESLARTYPTPEVMRHRANQLATARKDPDAKEMVRLMRKIADDMADGTLLDDGESDDRFAHCLQCGRDAPTTVDEFTTWGLATGADTREQVGVVCPDCRETQETTR